MLLSFESPQTLLCQGGRRFLRLILEVSSYSKSICNHNFASTGESLDRDAQVDEHLITISMATMMLIMVVVVMVMMKMRTEMVMMMLFRQG